ncbi:MAG: HAMP domain-containing protein [Deltaproteobacteria bacterium]|nr:HAMP domain-containing protein [Deltaproteobacteria bacterium]
MENEELSGIAGLEAPESTSDVEELTQKVDKALLERPGFSIRARLALVFLLFFILSAATTIGTWMLLARLQTRLQFIEIADQLNNEALQARRFEKNYFLYGTNLEDVLRHIETAHRHLSSSKVEFGSIVGMESLERLERHLGRYRELIFQLRQLEAPGRDNVVEQRAEIERTLRTHGAELVSFALELARRERSTVRTLLGVMKGVTVAFLLCFLVLSVYSADFLSRHIIRRLNRLMQLTKRIGEGDLSPIVPARKYRDEFTNLVVALNHMIGEVERRHQVMVQSHKLRAVGRLTAGVAHELNNPINNIMLTAAALREDYASLSDDERLDMTKDLVEQADRSRKIVRNLLDFAREGEIEMGKLDVREIVEESIALVANQLKLSRVKAKIDLPENLPPVNGDRQYLSQIFVNLALNAVDAMPQGGTLGVSADLEAEGGFLATHVSDTGSGIPDHILQSIFDPFFTTRPTGQGTGLGLSVSLGIARRHGGDIRVTSREGEGTTFTVLLPILEVPAALERDSSGFVG